MWPLLLGCAAFLPLYAFDRNKLGGNIKAAYLLFPLGMLMLAGSTAMMLFSGLPAVERPAWLSAVSYAAAAVFLAVEVYALFFALPFAQAYRKTGEKKLVDRGLYALCRHPGVLFFSAMYLFLWLGSGVRLMFWAFVLFTASDVLHVFVQDRCYFPKTLDGYCEYKKTTPFLIPTKSSFRRALKRNGL